MYQQVCRPIPMHLFQPSEQDTAHGVLLLCSLLLSVLGAGLPHASWFTLLPLLGVFVRSMRKGAFFALQRADILFFLWFAYVLSGLFLPSATLGTLLSAASMIAYLLPPLCRVSRVRLMRFYIGLGSVTAALALLEYASGHGAVGYVDAAALPLGGRACAFFTNPNILAVFLLPCLLFAVRQALMTPPWRNLLFAGAALLCLGGIAVTFCRGAWVAAALSVLYLTLSLTRSPLPVVILLCLTPALSLCLPSTVLSRLTSIVSGDSSVGYRLSLWRSIANLPKSTFLFGIGEGKTAFTAALSPYAAAGLEAIEHTHSLFLHVLLCHGVIGLLLFFCFLYVIFRQATPVIRATLLAFLLFGLFDDPLYTVQIGVIFWICASLGRADACSSACCSLDVKPSRNRTPPYTPFWRSRKKKPPMRLPSGNN